MRGTCPKRRYSGLTLVELLVAMLLTAILLAGLVQLVMAAGSASRLQDNKAALQDRVRHVTRLLASAISQAGFTPEPWNAAYADLAVGAGSTDRASATGDRLVLVGWSDLNCFGNRNPETDSDGRPLFYIRESSFDLNGSGNFTLTCRYGPSTGELVTQIRRQGLVQGVESFQCLFGEDSDDDGDVDRWARAGQWADERRLLGVRVGLLLAVPGPTGTGQPEAFEVLDTSHAARADGKLREVVELSLSIRSRNG